VRVFAGPVLSPLRSTVIVAAPAAEKLNAPALAPGSKTVRIATESCPCTAGPPMGTTRTLAMPLVLPGNKKAARKGTAFHNVIKCRAAAGGRATARSEG
jgi:hypothetical protein